MRALETWRTGADAHIALPVTGHAFASHRVSCSAMAPLPSVGRPTKLLVVMLGFASLCRQHDGAARGDDLLLGVLRAELGLDNDGLGHLALAKQLQVPLLRDVDDVVIVVDTAVACDLAVAMAFGCCVV